MFGRRLGLHTDTPGDPVSQNHVIKVDFKRHIRDAGAEAVVLMGVAGVEAEFGLEDGHEPEAASHQDAEVPREGRTA